jgi:cobaltochelatase CobN
MKAVFVFSHPTLFPVWDRTIAGLQQQGITAVVTSQMADMDWETFAVEEIADADAVYLNLSGHFPSFMTLIAAAKGQPVVVPGGTETIAAMTGQGIANSDLSLGTAIEGYVKSGSASDLANAVKLLLHHAKKLRDAPPKPIEPMLCGIFDEKSNQLQEDVAGAIEDKRQSVVALCFGRSLYVEDDMALPVFAVRALEKRGFFPLLIFCDWELATQFGKSDTHPLHRILSACGDQLTCIWNGLFSHTGAHEDNISPFEQFGVPVFQVIRNYSSTAEGWAQSSDGLSPMSVCYSLTQPEMLGCIEPTVLACNQQKESKRVSGKVNLADVVEDRVETLAERTMRWHILSCNAPTEKRVAIMLHNSPCKSVEATLASAAGLDAAESVVRLMRRLGQDGYRVDDIPESGQALIELFLERKAFSEFRWTAVDEIVRKNGALAFVDAAEYNDDFLKLDVEVQAAVNDAWGAFPAEAMVHPNETGAPSLVITGIEFGNILVMIDPKRGCYGPKCDGEVCRILHQPDIPPTHHFLATYFYLQKHVDAIVSMGAESSVEYLPGKRAGLSKNCYSEIALGTLPVIYPYIVTATGEGLIAKRRGRGVLIDHLSPAKKKVSDFSSRLDEIEDLHRQVLAASTVNDKMRLGKAKTQLQEKCVQSNLLPPEQDEQGFKTFFEMLPAKLSRLRNRKVDNKSHVMGQIPDDEARLLYEAEVEQFSDIDWNRELFYASLGQTENELHSVIHALKGRFIAPGPSGHLSRGKVDTVPTGRNFYGLDLKTVPTRNAWDVGHLMGEQLLQKYLKEENRFPKAIGITLWSSDVFRSEGELISQILWLLGCEPQWMSGGKVKGIRPLAQDGLTMEGIDGKKISRPRIDVLVQMSGVVRDTLPVFYQMLDSAVLKVSELDESDDVNFVRAHIQEQLTELQNTVTSEELLLLKKMAAKRVFSSKPGSYGVGVNLAIDAAAWQDDADLAEAFINWTGYAFGSGMDNQSEQTEKAAMAHYAGLLKSLDVSYQQASLAEYDALSCGCYSGFQGGMAAAKRGLGGGETKLYWGDSVTSESPEIRDLSEEIDLGFSSRLLNPDWVENQKEQGYRGASAVSTMVNAVHAWSATTHVVTKEQFDGICRVYVENQENQQWLRDANIYAFEEITRRLLEAQARGLWQANTQQLEVVQAAALSIEGDLEERIGETSGEFQGGNVDILTGDQVEKWQYLYRIGKDK